MNVSPPDNSETFDLLSKRLLPNWTAHGNLPEEIRLSIPRFSHESGSLSIQIIKNAGANAVL